MSGFRNATFLFLVQMNACASMSNLNPSSPDGRRSVCQTYVNDSASFIGQQQALGVIFASIAVTAGAAGAAVSNSDSGGAWSENKKTILLTSAIPAALLAYNFLGNASSAGTSASQASISLADKNEDTMWTGCEKARAAYFDGRVASMSSTSGTLSGKQSTPQAAETIGYADAAAALATQAAQASEAANKYVDDAVKTKDPNTAGAAVTHLDSAKASAKLATEAKEQAEAAVRTARKAVDDGNTRVAEQALNQAKEAKAKASKAADDANAAGIEYLK